MKPKMNRKKVLICMSLLVIIISALWISSWFIKINETETLYDFLCISVFPLMIGWYIGGKIYCFYKWLINKTEDNKNNKQDEQGTTNLNIFTTDLDKALQENFGDYLPLTKVADTAKTLNKKGWKFEKK